MKKVLSLTLAVLVAALFTLATSEIASAQSANAGTPKAKTGSTSWWGQLDTDGDGIPNCQDPDFIRPGDGTGRKLGKLHMWKGSKTDGGYGPGDGSGNSGIGPRDGTGFGTGAGLGSGNCDGTGPKGSRRGGK
jgi:hypothetical protein